MPPRDAPHFGDVATAGGGGYGGARLQAHPRGDVAARTAARVGAFVQGLLSARGACARASDVARLFRVIEGRQVNALPLTQPEEASLSRLVAEANAALVPLHLAVKRVTLPAPAARAAGRQQAQQQSKKHRRGPSNDDDENEGNENAPTPQQPRFGRDAAMADTESRSYYGIVNVEPDDVAQVHGWGLSPALLAYLRAVLERMVKVSKTACGTTPASTLLSIDHAADAIAEDNAATNRAVAGAMRETRRSSDGGGEIDEERDALLDGDSPTAASEARVERAQAAAAAARANARQPPPPLKRNERRPALDALAENGWLVRIPSTSSSSSSSSSASDASYGIGPRSFMELGELLRSFEPPESVLDAWRGQL